MSTEVVALLIFCEGPHDSAFVKMVMNTAMAFKIERLKLSEMPAPFNLLFSTSVKTHAAQDMSLDMAHKFFLPDTVLRKDDNVVFIYNCGGKHQYEKIKGLLSSYLPLLSEAITFSGNAEEVVASVKYLFLYDNDAEGIGAIAEKLRSQLGEIDGKGFIDDAWEKTNSDHGLIAKDKAVFVWGETAERGTLEDILMPMFEFAEENSRIVDKAKTAMVEMFEWREDDPKERIAVAETEKYKKAVLTTAGQRKKPGSSLNVILGQSGFVTLDSIKACKITESFIEFILNLLGANR